MNIHRVFSREIISGTYLLYFLASFIIFSVFITVFYNQAISNVVFTNNFYKNVDILPKKLNIKENKQAEANVQKKLVSRQWNRSVESFNLGWIFALADETKNELAEDISIERWRRVDLPHDWGVDHPTDSEYPSGKSGGYTKTGLGWYIKTFTVPNNWQDRRVFVDFGGVFMNSEVWINGQWLGLRPYGFTSFRYDLTPYLKFGEPNKIKVRVDNVLQRSARWYTGSGIYRNVNLVVTDPVNVDNWGTYVQTPEITEKEATISLNTKVSNTLNKSINITVRTTIAGQKTESMKVLPAGSKKEYIQTLKVKNPNLWSTEDPDLYTAVTEVISNNKVIDRYETPFGIRTVVFDPQKGLLINGNPIKLKGVCIHEDGGGAVGTAVPIDIWERRFKILQKMGCNAVRCSHNPFSDEIYDLADRMGMIVIAEAFDEWKVGKCEHAYADYFDEWSERDLKDMILRTRNHPSIIMWSIGNEIEDIKEPEGSKTAAFLCDIIKGLDTTRPTTIALSYTPEKDVELYKLIDNVGINFGHWDIDGKPSRYTLMHQQHEDRFIYGSETTHSYQTRGVYKTQTFSRLADKQPNLTDEEIFPFNKMYTSSYDNAFVEHHNRFTLAYMRDNSWLAGEFRWTGIDYLGEAGSYPTRFKDFGIIDMCGYPKDSYYLYKSVWTNENVLHILPHWNWKGMEGIKIPVWIYANNCDEVELYVNGKSMGRKNFDYQALYASWNVPYTPGELRAISYKSGKKIKEMIIKTAGQPAYIELVIDKEKITPNHKDVIHAQVRILDANGNFVPNANNRIKFSVSGPAKILGSDNGDPLDLDPLKSDNRKAFNGMCLAIIQSEFETGKVIVKAESDGVKSAQCSFSIKGDSPGFQHQYLVPSGIKYNISNFELNLNLPKQKDGPTSKKE